MRLCARAFLSAVLLLGAPVFAQNQPEAPTVSKPAPAPAPAPKSAPVLKQPTPMAERLVGLAALNKDSGRVLRFNAKPGQYLRFESLLIRVKACEANPPWERPQNAAFIQVDEQKGESVRRIFSGWLYAENPGVNAVEHPRYDVWVTSCAMRFPEIGPATVVASKPASAASTASSAEKSPSAASASPN